MQTDVEMRDWVAEHIDRSDPWGWFVGTASDFIQRTRNIKKENSSLGELSLGWLDTLLEENRGEAELSRPILFPRCSGWRSCIGIPRLLWATVLNGWRR